jgi:hypothetical protein
MKTFEVTLVIKIDESSNILTVSEDMHPEDIWMFVKEVLEDTNELEVVDIDAQLLLV